MARSRIKHDHHHLIGMESHGELTKRRSLKGNMCADCTLDRNEDKRRRSLQRTLSMIIQGQHDDDDDDDLAEGDLSSRCTCCMRNDGRRCVART